MRIALACALVACSHGGSEPAVTVKVTCADHTSSLAVRGDQRLDDHLCGSAWQALRIEHGARTELVRAVAGREVWVRRAGPRAVIELRSGSAIASSFDGVTEIADESHPATQGASIEVDANGAVTSVPLTELRTRAGAGSDARDVSLCAFAATYIARPAHIEVSDEELPPVTMTFAECTARGYVLRVSSQGELRLRTAAGDHVLQHVTSIRVTL